MFFRSYVCAYGIFIGYGFKEDCSRTINPIVRVKERHVERKATKEAEAEKDYWSDVFENLENYDGFKESQKEVRNVER